MTSTIFLSTLGNFRRSLNPGLELALDDSWAASFDRPAEAWEVEVLLVIVVLVEVVGREPDVEVILELDNGRLGAAGLEGPGTGGLVLLIVEADVEVFARFFSNWSFIELILGETWS